ncbi:MAG: 4Fe-4S dicluster domain-containing protein [Desulfobacteraceae bacterium]|nr:MAG: 4Fe-4S dicluster domain-containing protein [Desulfobacteraceae bacterium]
MTDIYTDLAQHLDKLPAGYPATDTGVELRILKRLFTEEEARITLGLSMMPEPVAPIARRLDMDEEKLAPKLKSMSEKGLIFRSGKGGVFNYMAAQFVIGIWEYHLNDLSPELIRDVNEYLPVYMHKSWTQHDTKQLRVIPVSETIAGDMNILPYEVAEEIIRQQSKIVVSDCICRKEHQMMDNGCDYPMEVCLAFGTGAFYYEENGLGRSIDPEEALTILNQGRDAGLVLQPGNAQKPANLCMCCGCCCQVLKNLKTLDNPAAVVHSNYYAQVDEDECTGCSECVERCHVDAITMEDTAQVAPQRCIGCGVCIPACPADALALLQKDAPDQYVPPANVFETYFNMAKERGNI